MGKEKNFGSPILCADGTKTVLFGHRDVTLLWRRGDVFNPKNSIPTVKHGDGNLMFWGVFQALGQEIL